MYCGTWHHSREREIQRSRFIRCHPSWIDSSSFHAKTTANQSHSHIALHRAFQVTFVSSSHASSCTLKLARVACVVLPHPVSPWINLVKEQEAARETQLLSSSVQPTGACVSCKSLQVHASGQPTQSDCLWSVVWSRPITILTWWRGSSMRQWHTLCFINIPNAPANLCCFSISTPKNPVVSSLQFVQLRGKQSLASYWKPRVHRQNSLSSCPCAVLLEGCWQLPAWRCSCPAQIW